jgi:hypothetical protein
MSRPEYMRFHISQIPDEIIDAYNLRSLAHNDWIYVKINKGIYGLPQVGILANKILVKRLATPTLLTMAPYPSPHPIHAR